MWEWLRQHPTGGAALETALIAVSLAVFIAAVGAVLLSVLWIARIWAQRGEFVARAIPEGRAIRWGGAQVDFDGPWAE